MATKASSLLRAARKALLASRAAAAAASRAARAADVAADAARASRLSLDLSRAARAADVAADAARASRLSLNLGCSCSNPRFHISADYEHLPEDSKTPTEKDLESDDAVWALYERWCVAFNKNRNYAEMIRRFEIFRYRAEDVYRRNTDVPADPKKAAIFRKKRREAKLLLSKGENVSHFDECYLPAFLGPLADGADPFLCECDYKLLKDLEKRDARRAPKDVTVE